MIASNEAAIQRLKILQDQIKFLLHYADSLNGTNEEFRKYLKELYISSRELEAWFYYNSMEEIEK